MVQQQAAEGMRSAAIAIIVNAALAGVKLVAGIVGHTYALIADAIESSADIMSSAIVWGGLRLAAREADEEYPFGYGKAESLAGAVVAMMLVAAGIGIAVQASREIRTPHHTPAPWTLAVLVVVVITKWTLSRRVAQVGHAIGSTSVKADAWHHMSDAVTSAAAFIGISVAILGSYYDPGSRWETADDWAAVVASVIIISNGFLLLRPAVADLMDRAASPELLRAVQASAEAVAGVLATEKIAIRKAGLAYRATLHVQADPMLTLAEAHSLSGKVKAAIKAQVPSVTYVLVHMEPFEPGT